MEGRATRRAAVTGPTGSQPTRLRRDWSARARLHVADPQSYTRFVTIMKRALLLAALALIAAVIAYSLQPREQDRVAMTFERMGNVANDLAMIKPRLTGTDASGNPFVVTADSAAQDGRNAHRARLKNVQADIALGEKAWLTASAESGLLDADARTLKLSGAIAIYSDSGYELHTEGGDVDLKSGIMRGLSPVTGQGPLGTIRADRFTVDRNARQIRLDGNVRMDFYSRGAKKS